MKKYALFIFVVMFVKSIAQNVCKDNIIISNFDKNNFISDSLFLEKKYEKSLEFALYNLLEFNNKRNSIIIQKENTEYENVFSRVIRAYGELNKIDSAIYWLDSLNNCIKPNYLFYFYPEFNSLSSINSFTNYYTPSIDSIKNLNTNLNTKYFIILSKLAMSQWLYMRIIFDNKSLLSKNKKYYDNLIEGQNKIRENSLMKLDSILESLGIPNKVEVTKIGLENLYSLIIQSVKSRYKYQYLFDMLFKESVIDLNQYSRITDENLIHENCPQKYGTQYWYDYSTQQYYYYPIEDVQNIDKIRKEIGLYSIKDQNSSIGLKVIQIKSNGIQY
ncbi:MAG: hypothetical protein U0T31_09090 [Chitinophagales bacterium]